jgi:flagellar assembly factor FliW
MPICKTKYFGDATYDEASVIHFCNGLPGFESETRFLPMEQPAQAPLVFLQSLSTADLCFVALPVQAVDPSYQFDVAESDLELLDLDPSRQPATGKDLLCLAIVTVSESGVTANLLAPVLINALTLKAVQAVSPNQCHSHRHPVGEPWEQPVCS